MCLPKTYKEAVGGDDPDEWKRAMDEEIESFKETETFELVERPKDAKVVRGKWVYSSKGDPTGNIIHKARFVAKGCSQVQGVNYEETFSPTARMESVRLLIAVAINNDYKIHQMDVRRAYLHAPIDCDIYCEQPEGYEAPQEGGSKLVWKLLKSLYGLKQSGRNWHKILSDFLKQSGFTQSKVDTCVFVKLEVGGTTILLVWVDDIILVASSDELMNFVKSLLMERFRMKDLGQICFFLGIEFTPRDGGLLMSQTMYLKSVLKRFGMDSCKPRGTPCEMKVESYSVNEGTIDIEKYREMVGSLVYAMVCTRPDLSYVVTKLSQHLSCPTEGDLVTMKHVFQYIQGTLDQGLFFSKQIPRLSAYCDADWGSTCEDRKSITGYCFSLSPEGPVISWKSKKQKSVALSTCEAEYVAISIAAQEASYLTQLYKDMTGITMKPVLIRNDNTGAISIIKNPSNHHKTKHIDIRYHYVRENNADGNISVQYVKSGKNIADMFTKACPKQKLISFKPYLFGY